MKATFLVAGAVTALLAVPAFGQTMVGEAHDFSNTGWAEGQICLPCHTPHHAVQDEEGSIGFLWNHEITTATYTLYADAGTAFAGPDNGEAAFDSRSRLCMSCHDGTVAVDSFGGMPGSIFATGRILIGTDLTDDHPVGVTAVYPEQGNAEFQAANDHRLGPNNEMSLYEMQVSAGNLDYVVGCATCHTPHYAGFDMQLRMTNASSALCLSCHIK